MLCDLYVRYVELSVVISKVVKQAYPRTGTTGTPKGVDVTHSNVTNLVCLSPGNLGIRPGIKVGQVLNISFDMGKQDPISPAFKPD